MIESFTWHCPRLGCKKFIMAYTEAGLRSFSEDHIEQHIREDRENNVQTAAISLFRGPKNYNVLNLTGQDIAFLKTRGVAIDDKVQYDPCLEEKPVSDTVAERELSRS